MKWSQGRKLNAGTEQRPWRKDTDGTRLCGLVSWLFYTTSWSGVGPPTVDWALPHQSWRCPYGETSGAFFSTEVPSFQMIRLLLRWQKLTITPRKQSNSIRWTNCRTKKRNWELRGYQLFTVTLSYGYYGEPTPNKGSTPTQEKFSPLVLCQPPNL